MTREEAIQTMKEAFNNAQNKLEYEKNIQDRLQLLEWLESCKNISESYPEMCKKIDRLEEENTCLLEYTVCHFPNRHKERMIPMIMIKDKPLLIQRIKNSLSFTAVEKRYLIKAVELAPETIEEDKEDAGDEKQRRS